VLRILPGPAGTVALGYANGVVGLWSLANGQRIEHGRIHGPVIHLVMQGPRLLAATGLGDHLGWSFPDLEAPYCEVLRRVWKDVPIRWEGGLPVLREPPRDHRCSRARP